MIFTNHSFIIMNRKLILICTVALTFAVACTKEQPGEEPDKTEQTGNSGQEQDKEDQTENPGEGTEQKGEFRLLASSGSLSSSEIPSKTGITADYSILWKAGDKLSVWEKDNASNSNVPMTLDESSAESATGFFNGTITPAGGQFEINAIYPYSEIYGDSAESLSLSIPTETAQSTDLNSIVGKTDFMIGRTTNKDYDSESGSYKMLFKHPLAFVKFVIDGRGCVYEEATIKSLTMTADVAFVGPVRVNLIEGTVVSAAEGDEGKTLVVNFPETAKMNSLQEAWVAINPVDLSNANCRFVLEMTNGQKVTFSVNPRVMAEQSLYKFEFNNIDTKISEGKATPTYVDLIGLSGGARANCYIVNEGGYYKFAAQRVDKTNVFEGTNPQTAGYRANWIWATGSESRVDNVSFGNSGNINFRVKPYSNGNTIIALFDPSKKIVWSWHVWCSTTDPMNPTHYTRNNAWLMADRNLGALSNAEGDVNSYGLMYQWGRKDPFPGPGILGSYTSAASEKTAFVTNTQSYVFNPDQTVVTQFKSTRNSNTNNTGDIAYTIAHPTENIHFYSSGTTGLSNTWLYTTSQDEAKLLWNSTGNLKGKTNYDPCPPGWMVPVSNAYAWHSNYWTDSNYKWETNDDLSGVVFNEAEDNKTYYPAVGYRSSGQLKNAGFACYYWSALAAVDGSNLIAYSLQCERKNSKFATNGKIQTHYALPVRCMKMN